MKDPVLPTLRMLGAVPWTGPPEVVRRPVRTVAVLVAVVLTASGCGFVNAMAHPEEQTTEASRAAPVAAAPTTAVPAGPVTVVEATLEGAGDLALEITVGPVRTGLVPPFPEFSDGCPVSGPSLQYVAVSFGLIGNPGDYSGLAGHLTVTPGPATPGDIGDVGVFFGPSPGHDVYCADYPPLPTTDTFWSHGGPNVVTGYVVLDQAVTAATPQGRTEVFPTLQARIDHLRVKDGETLVERKLHVTAVQRGTQCPDDADAFCVPLA